MLVPGLHEEPDSMGEDESGVKVEREPRRHIMADPGAHDRDTRKRGGA